VLKLTAAGQQLRDTAHDISQQIISLCAINASTADKLMDNLDILNGNLGAALSG
jgi:hypothetical protein